MIRYTVGSPYTGSNSFQEINAVNVLIICSANMCRSPMAEVLLRDLSRKANLSITVRSAGTMDIEGAEAVLNARTVCRENGLSLEGFKSTALSRVELEDFDIILTMEVRHRKIIQELVEGSSPTVRLLGEFLPGEKQPFEIADPVGRDIAAFQDCFALLKRCLDGFLYYAKTK